MNNKIVKTDIMRYKKNKLSANLALLGLLFGAIYFMIIYGIYAEGKNTQDIVDFFYKPYLGLSVIVNLVFLLMVFFCSEEVKAYNIKFAYVLFVIAAFQIGRMFYYPVTGHIKNAMSDSNLAVCIIFLAASAACLIASGVFAILRTIEYKKHKEAIESGKLDMDAYLKQLDAEEEAASNVAEEAPVEEAPVEEPAKEEAVEEQSPAEEEVEKTEEDK